MAVRRQRGPLWKVCKPSLQSRGVAKSEKPLAKPPLIQPTLGCMAARTVLVRCPAMAGTPGSLAPPYSRFPPSRRGEGPGKPLKAHTPDPSPTSGKGPREAVGAGHPPDQASGLTCCGRLASVGEGSSSSVQEARAWVRESARETDRQRRVQTPAPPFTSHVTSG